MAESSKKPLAVDAVKPQVFSESKEKIDDEAIEKELDAMEAAIATEETSLADSTTEMSTESPEQQKDSEPQGSEKPIEAPEPSVEGLDDEQPPKTEKDKPSFADQLSQTSESQFAEEPPRITTKKERKIFKFIRIIIWLFVAIMLPVSIFIIKNSENPAAYANNTHEAQLNFGQTFFWIALGVGITNFIWGIIRWVMRIVRNHCKIGRIIGKLIGGGIWRFFVFAPIILLSFIFIAPAINNKIRSDVIEQYKETIDGHTIIENDFESGKITVDQYVKYSLDYLFNPDNLPDHYKDNSEEAFLHLDYDFIDKHLDELSDETIESIGQVLLLTDINIDTDASGNISKRSAKSPFMQNASAASSNKSVKTLNKAKLSPNGTTVIFYTDTGADAISDDEAEGVGRVMDNVVAKAKDIFGIDYKYQVVYSENTKNLDGVKKVLKASGIDENVLDTLGVVYITDPTAENSKLKAYHTHPYLSERTLFDKIIARIDAKINGEEHGLSFINSSPVEEFTVIKPEFVYLENGNLSLNTEEVVSHEFAHAIQWSYCRDSIGAHCTAQTLSIEGTAHLFATNAVSSHSSNSLLAENHNEYIRNSCNRLENAISADKDIEYGCNSNKTYLGYPTVAFWQNYYEIVPNAPSIIAHSWTQENTIEYLYEQAGATNFRNIMKQLSQRNVTNSYKDSIKNALTAQAYPGGNTLYCGGLCIEKYSMAPTSLKYLYLSAEDHREIKISVQAPNSTAVSFIKPGGSHQILKDGNGKVDYALTEETGVIIIAVANASLESADFIVSITTNDLEDLIEKVDIDFTTNNPFKEMSNGCVELDVDGLVNSLSEIGGFVKGINSELSGIIDLSFVTEELDRAEGQAKEARENLKGNKISICSNKVKKGIDFAAARKKLKEVLIEKTGLIPLDLAFFDKNEKDFKLTVFAGINPLNQSGRIYVLTNTGGASTDDLMLFNINVTQK